MPLPPDANDPASKPKSRDDNETHPDDKVKDGQGRKTRPAKDKK